MVERSPQVELLPIAAEQGGDVALAERIADDARGAQDSAAVGAQLGDAAGQVFVFFILTVAAAEAAIGLAILVTLFRNRRTIDVADIDTLKG